MPIKNNAAHHVNSDGYSENYSEVNYKRFAVVEPGDKQSLSVVLTLM
jgi:hypothetical protein